MLTLEQQKALAEKLETFVPVKFFDAANDLISQISEYEQMCADRGIYPDAQ